MGSESGLQRDLGRGADCGSRTADRFGRLGYRFGKTEVWNMTKEKPFSATFKLEKETKNTMRHAEEAEGRWPVVGTVYIDKYELPKPFPEKIRVTIEPTE